jgi:hypothetical protein
VPRSAAAARAAGKPLPAGAGRARLAVGTIFFVNGLLLASWLPHIPAVKARLVLSDAELGW